MRRKGQRIATGLTAIYVAVLVLCAWPAVLSPKSGFVPVQTAANRVLATLGWPAGLEVFSGRTGGAQATRMSCFQIEGELPSGERRELYSTFKKCERGEVDMLKDPYEIYHRRILSKALPMMRGAPPSRSQYPISDFFAISDFYCRALSRERVPGSQITYRAIYITSDMVSGAPQISRVEEGIHHCHEGAWQQR